MPPRRFYRISRGCACVLDGSNRPTEYGTVTFRRPALSNEQKKISMLCDEFFPPPAVRWKNALERVAEIPIRLTRIVLDRRMPDRS
jgi:hypothetical protein